MSGVMLVNSLMFAVGLAFESFMVAMANGLNGRTEPRMGMKRAVTFAAVFAVCHAAALWIGYAVIGCVRYAGVTEDVLTWCAVAVLLFLGIKMTVGGIKELRRQKRMPATGVAEFAVQSVVAALDAFAVGLTIPDYNLVNVALCAMIITAVIFVFFIAGYTTGKKLGKRIGKFAVLLSGAVFIGLAIEVIVGAVG